MVNNPFNIGEEPTLEQVLDTRERRVEFQEKLAKKFEGEILTAFKLNIPGPVKNNDAIRNLFTRGLKKIKMELNHHGKTVLFEKKLDEITGPEAFLITEGGLEEIKRLMVRVEESSPTGRLYDLDVMRASENKIDYISRGNLNLPQRECLICGKPAKVCGRSRAHSVEIMVDRIYALTQEEENNLIKEDSNKPDKEM